MSAATLASLADRLCVPTALCSMFKVLLPVHSHLPPGEREKGVFCSGEEERKQRILFAGVEAVLHILFTNFRAF